MSDFWMRLVAALSLTIMGGLLFGFFWTVGSSAFRSWHYDQAERQAKKDGWASFQDRNKWDRRQSPTTGASGDSHKW